MKTKIQLIKYNILLNDNKIDLDEFLHNIL